MIPVIGIASGLGGSHEGSGQGPLLIQENFSDIVKWKKVLRPEANFQNKRQQIQFLNQKLAEETCVSVSQHPFTVVIGGDHSCAIGTWSGVAEALRAQGEDLALIWIDAHMDSHTPETTPSGNIHGMPLATLLGYGHEDLTQILSPHPKLKPENVFLIGIRSYEDAEKKFLEKHNVRVYYVEEVQERGLKEIFSEITENLKERNLRYGLTVDIDFFDAEEMSATGTPAENGVDPQEFIDSYNIIDRYPPIVFEYVEFNPPCDTDNKSLVWTLQILERALETRITASEGELAEVK